MVMTERFKVAPLGVAAWIWTIIYIILTLYFALITVLDLASGRVPDVIDITLTIVLVPLMVYSWIRSVRGYRLEGKSIIIDRAGPGKIEIPISQIEQVNGKPDLGSFFNIGLLSLGGVFGWAGRARVRKPADVNSVDAEVYGTNAHNMLLLEMKSGNKIILTPRDPQAMETSLKIAGVGAMPDNSAARNKPRVARSAKRKQA
jgi:NhaP-type Na+/H+ and K+/H+ antiporter